MSNLREMPAPPNETAELILALARAVQSGYVGSFHESSKLVLRATAWLKANAPELLNRRDGPK